MNRKWYWPTDEGWFLIIGLLVMASIAGGWLGFLVMFGFFVFVICGNWIGI